MHWGKINKERDIFMSVALQVSNDSAVSITVTGSRGSNFSGINEGQVIKPGESQSVGSFDTGLPGEDNWGWVYLNCGNVASQIYAESNRAGETYLFFGYYNPESSESNSNPSPFPDGVAYTTVDEVRQFVTFLYVLNEAPPAL